MFNFRFFFILLFIFQVLSINDFQVINKNHLFLFVLLISSLSQSAFNRLLSFDRIESDISNFEIQRVSNYQSCDQRDQFDSNCRSSLSRGFFG